MHCISWLPDAYSQIFRSYVFGPSGFWTMPPLRYAAKFDPFLSLNCAPRPPTWRNPRRGRDQILPSGNLAGRLGNMELFVILEYCRHGNLLQYLRKNRRSFSSGTIVRNRSIGSRYSRIPGSALSPAPATAGTGTEPRDSVFFKRISSSNSGDSARSTGRSS